jgi:hypothetical protein
MSDLTKEEQVNVRTALRYLRARCGGWAPVSKALRFRGTTLVHVVGGQTVSASLAVRVARLAGVSVDDVLTGRYPEVGTCPYCGHRPESPTTEAAR